MSEFEYTESSGNDSSSDEDIPIIPIKGKIDNTAKISKELHLCYSNLFIDCFNVLDTFVKSRVLTYSSFLNTFISTNFHHIYAKRKGNQKNLFISPHHYIMIAQESLAAASKFLRSKCKDVRIGAVYLLYTIYKTQPLKQYQLNVKMKPIDYKATIELVKQCTNEGLLYPAFCFYELDYKRKITITVSTISPCLEASYPRKSVRKLMGRTAEKYFNLEYEERAELDFGKLQLMESQLRTESSYIKKLEQLVLGTETIHEYKSDLTRSLEAIKVSKKCNTTVKEDDLELCSKIKRYKNKKNVAFPGKNEDVLEDMITTAQLQTETSASCSRKENTKHLRKRRKIGGIEKTKTTLQNLKSEPSALTALSDLSDSSSSTESEMSQCSMDSLENQKNDDLIRRVLEASDSDEANHSSQI
ncbi:uncharacterized protein LOC126846528 [Adelges cooleyi]|uniref:uncharacterized protein LOC126846528 n=1 Tax=Adelges cooleyi TaxID=133065 RepID=UPI0021808C47|nr:uncharacterized protein LOC126846528 [Adelges cooleyi]XP_050441978.1 uncharacterized protein LOC126846528 [Adelges cooleyi]XP_050441979.1 uncharacterized protein LOC126846528 [Adelges cooleyi]XP_050441980.1 uncharacterized protein LOC126846528 [Adelges cooleyi]